jgi:hypothetical protein
MAKLLEAIEALAKIDATRALAESLRADLGALTGVEAKDLATRLSGAEGQVAELTTQVRTLGPKAAGADALKATVDKYEGEKRTGIIAKAFATAAAAAGIPAAAIPTAQKLANLASLQVDLDKGEVSGLTKDIFDGLRKEHPVLFTPADAGAPPPGAAPIPPLGPAGTGGTTAPAMDVPGPIGFFAKR